MMDCKKALVEAQGDFEEAKKILRKKGLAAAASKAGRAASEGLVVSHVTVKGGVLLEVNCETDFVARTEEFRVFTEKLADRIGIRAWRHRRGTRRRSRAVCPTARRSRTRYPADRG
jgi:elongation factor Ts